MSADVLREAAALMRSRAEAATGAKHHWRTGVVRGTPTETVFCGQVRIAQTDETLTGGPSNAAHIASWHPAVALAVADWLDSEAEELAEALDALAFLGPVDKATGRFGRALAVATAYLGTQP